MFEQATANGSNPDLGIYDVEWQYWVNPQSVTTGGSTKFTNKDKLMGIKDWNKTLRRPTRNITQMDYLKDISCGAQSLGITLHQLKLVPEYNGPNPRHKSITFTKFCKDLELKMMDQPNDPVSADEFTPIDLSYIVNSILPPV